MNVVTSEDIKLRERIEAVSVLEVNVARKERGLQKMNAARKERGLQRVNTARKERGLQRVNTARKGIELTE